MKSFDIAIGLSCWLSVLTQNLIINVTYVSLHLDLSTTPVLEKLINSLTRTIKTQDLERQKSFYRTRQGQRLASQHQLRLAWRLTSRHQLRQAWQRIKIKARLKQSIILGEAVNSSKTVVNRRSFVEIYSIGSFSFENQISILEKLKLLQNIRKNHHGILNKKRILRLERLNG